MLCIAGGIFGSFRRSPVRQVRKNGYNIPAFLSMADFKVWEEEGLPKVTLYNYPVKPQHKAEAFVSGYPAPPNIAAHIYNEATMAKMIAKITQGGNTPAQAIAWAERELEGFKRAKAKFLGRAVTTRARAAAPPIRPVVIRAEARPSAPG